MFQRSIGICGSMVTCLLAGLIALPEADAHGGRGGGGHQSRKPPRVNASHGGGNRAFTPRASGMPHAASISHAHTNAARSVNNQVHSNNSASRVNNSVARANNSVARANSTTGLANGTTGLANNTQTRLNASGTPASRANLNASNSYTYGTGQNARNYRATGYGSGYRNRYYGGRSGYGRSQGNSMAIVSRLRSVHSTLSRIDHDYRGHRSRAVHEISMAIRQLTHRSMIYSGSGFNGGANTRLTGANGMRNGGVNGRANNGGRRTMILTQAQSDSRMSHAMRTTQGISMQLSNQGSYSSSHSRAQGHLQRAVREMGTALAIR